MANESDMYLVKFAAVAACTLADLPALRAAHDRAVARAEKAEQDLTRLTSLVQMCCDGSSEDDPVALCARRVSELIAHRDEAGLLLLNIWDSDPYVVEGALAKRRKELEGK